MNTEPTFCVLQMRDTVVIHSKATDTTTITYKVTCPECKRLLVVTHNNWHRYKLLCPGKDFYEQQRMISDQQHLALQKKQAQRSKGLGDTVYKALRKLGIRGRGCGGCGRRRKWLNKKFPYRQR
jgi:hypothetical protein